MDENNREFNLLKGMHYRINAEVPRLDISGNAFFTMRNVRSWIYGHPNEFNSHLIYFKNFTFKPEVLSA